MKAIEKVVDKGLEIFYSKDKTKLYVLILTLAALIIRLIAAHNLGMNADDANGGVLPIGIIGSGKLEEIGQSSALWFYIQDFLYKIWGTSQLSSRTATAIIGSLTVIVMFLFVSRVFKSKKAGLIAAGITAFSPYFVRMTLPEMDITANFFVLLSGLFVFKFVDEWKRRDLFLGGLFIGLGIMIKVYPLFFAFGYTLFLIYSYHANKKFNKKAIKKLLVFFMIILVFCIPTLTYNYLLYKDKGFMDLMFTNVFKIGVEKAKPYLDTGAGFAPPSDYRGFFLGNQINWVQQYPESSFYKLPGFLIALLVIAKEDPVILLPGLFGLLLLVFRKDKRYLPFFLLTFILPFIYIGTNIPMLKHLTFVPVLFVPIAASILDKSDNLIKKKFPKFKIRYILLVLILFNLLWMGNPQWNIKAHIYTENGEGQLINYKANEISPNSLVVVDSRIYRGYDAWIFHDRYYLEANLFGQAVEESKKYGNPVSTQVYFVECATDDCGWGTVAQQPEFNKSMEDLASWFANNSKQVKEIDAASRYKYYFPLLHEQKKSPIYRIYKTDAMLSPAILQIARSTHLIINGFPVGYDRTIKPMFDDYAIHGAFDALLNKFAFFIMYSAMVLFFLTALYVIYLLIVEDNPSNVVLQDNE